MLFRGWIWTLAVSIHRYVKQAISIINSPYRITKIDFFFPSSIVSKLESLNIDHLKKLYDIFYRILESKINFPTWKISKRS